MENSYKNFLKILCCPSCRGILNQKALQEQNGEIFEGVLLCSCGLWYPITNGIPRMFIPGPLRPSDNAFIRKWRDILNETLVPLLTTDESRLDQQVQKTFGYKWKKQNWWGMEGATAQFVEKWLLPRYGWQSKKQYIEFFAHKKVCLDAGCGLGREALRMASANPKMLAIGLDLSECVDEARKYVITKGLKNVFFIQADLNMPPLARESIDFIISEGVLHHTPDTKKAFFALVPLLSKGGEIGFYVYRKKAPLREYADDFIREQIINLSPEEAWNSLKSLTKLGKTLSELNVVVNIEEDIPLLGIKKGKYDLQRLIYYNFFKCFWNPEFSFDENVLINYDWYTPAYAWRHTEEEVRNWLYEAGLSLIHEEIEESGITVIGRKN